MKIDIELLIADLTQKLRRGLIDPHGANLEDDLRAAIKLSESADMSWHTSKPFTDSAESAD